MVDGAEANSADRSGGLN